MQKFIHKTKEYVEKLRAKPYSTRKRLMWFYSVITIIIILLLWSIYIKNKLQLNFSKPHEEPKKNQIVIPSLFENLKEFFSDFAEFLKPKPNFDENGNENEQ